MVHTCFGSPQAGIPTGKISQGGIIPVLAALLTVGLLLPFSGSSAQAADPSYVSLLRQGALALQQKDYEEAELNLRLACFGLLDDLELLPEGLTRLALAQEATGDLDGFRETFQRIQVIEERFGAYSEHPPEPALKEAFEAELAAHVPETLLGSEPAFEGVRRLKVIERLSSQPKEERARSLDALIAAAPSDRLWRMQRARLALSEGSPAEAVPHLDTVLAEDPNDQEARCLRGQSLVLDRCPEAVADLMSCPQRNAAPRMAYDLADCLVEMGDLPRASLFLASLEGEARSDRALSKLRRRVERDLQQQRKKTGSSLASEDLAETDEPATPGLEEEILSESDAASEQNRPADLKTQQPPPELPASSQQTTQDTPRVLATPPAPLTPEQRAKMSQARSLLASAQRASDLEPALAAAIEVADARKDVPEAQQLAGEIAYRSSRWHEAAKYFRRGGDPSDARPNLLFFMAVSFYETGDLQAAREALDRSLPKLQRTEFVETYRNKIQE